MPFERFDGLRRGSSSSFYAKTAQYFRQYRYPSLAVITALSAFTLYQQSYFERYANHAPPTNLGWQSGLPAYLSRTSTSSGSSASTFGGDGDDAVRPGDLQGSEDDWWNDFDDTAYNDAYDGFAPVQTTEEWDPFILNPRPLVEITAKSCIWPPSVYDTCMPDSTMREDAERGKWLRVEKDLNLRIGVYYLYLFYRRLPLGSSAPTIREFKLVTKGEEKYIKLDESEGWKKVGQNLRDGIFPSQEPIYLYYRTESRSNGNYSGTEINEIDVVWGSSGTLYGWERMHRDFAEPKEKDVRKDNDEGAELMYRRGAPRAPTAPQPMVFSADGNYKILQIADLHFSVGKGKCLDSNWPGCKDPKGSDNVTLEWLGSVLDEEKPDLVVLSGDQLNGQDTSYSSESVILKIASLFASRKTPWAAVLGNHDSEKTTLTRYGQFIMMQALPYFVGEPGPIGADGEGNYQLKLYSHDESHTHLFSLYFLDSHEYAKSLNPFASEYDYLKDSQRDWFIEQSNLVRPIERPFVPPTIANSTFGLIPVEEEDAGLRRSRAAPRRLGDRQAAAKTKLKKPNAMAVFHIPLPEFYDEAPDIDTKSKSPLAVGNMGPGRGAPKKNSHFFDGAVLAQTELGTVDLDGLDPVTVEEDPDYAQAVLQAKPEVKVLMHGHCHTTDQCRRVRGVWMCFAGGSSYSGWSEVGFDRRVRVYQLSDYGETISTYKVLDTHLDTSGVSDASHVDGDDVDGIKLGIDPSRYLQETPLPAESGDPYRARLRTSRQESRHQRIDEMVLVGAGAPS